MEKDDIYLCTHKGTFFARLFELVRGLNDFQIVGGPKEMEEACEYEIAPFFATTANSSSSSSSEGNSHNSSSSLATLYRETVTKATELATGMTTAYGSHSNIS